MFRKDSGGIVLLLLLSNITVPFPVESSVQLLDITMLTYVYDRTKDVVLFAFDERRDWIQLVV